MKKTLYFNSEEEMNEYFPDGVPSGVLAVVGEEGVLYASSNNFNSEGELEEQGGYIMNPEQEEELNYSYAGAVDYYTYGATMSYVADYVNTYAPAPDLTGYATESYVTNAISDVIGAAPETLDTLQELAYALNDDANFASYVSVELGKKADKTEIPDLTGYATETYVASYVATYGGENNVQANWNESDSSADSYILNKPDLSDYVSKSELSNCSYITLNDVPAPDLSTYVSKSELDSMSYASQSYVADYVATYAAGEANVQSDWNESDSSADSYILNKPELNYLPLSGGTLTGTTYVKNNTIKFSSNVFQNDYDVTVGNVSSNFYVDAPGIMLQGNNKVHLMVNNQHKIYAYGIGNFTGSSVSGASDLATVISNLESSVGGPTYFTQASNGAFYLNNPNNSATGAYAVALGWGINSTFKSLAQGDYSFVFGDGNHAKGNASIVGGSTCYAGGRASVVIGQNLIANSDYQAVFGKYNAADSDALFIIGNGSGLSTIKNAFVISKTNNLYAYGIGNYDGTNPSSAQSLSYVINDIQSTLGSAASIATAIVGQ